MSKPSSSSPVQTALKNAVARHQAGDLSAAEQGYRRVLEMQPGHPDALDLLGVVALQSGHPEPALDLIGQALAQNRRHPAYRTHEGMALTALGRHQDAAASFERALKADNKFYDAVFNLGQSLLTLGRPADALKRFTRAGALAPGNPEPMNAQGAALMALGEVDKAETAFRKALDAAPQYPDARRNLATLLLEHDRASETEQEALTLLRSVPGHPDVLALLGKALLAQDRAQEALDALIPHRNGPRRSLEFDMTLGDALMQTDRPEDALSVFDAARAQAPGVAGIAYNIGLARKATGDLIGARAAYDDAIALDPALADLVYNRGLLAMTQGDFAAGLPDYEARWTKTELDTLPRDFPAPLWSGAPLAEDETLLVWAEQGVGDHIIFARLLDAVRARAGSVVFECDPRLQGLIARAHPDVTVIVEKADPHRPIDAQIPMGSLMWALAPWPEGFIPPARSLEPDPARVDAFANTLRDLGDAPKIGIAWRSARHKVGPRKSVPLDLWGPILSGRDTHFVNLQYGETDAEVADAINAFGCSLYTDPDLDRFDDLDGLAALIEGLDLVITTSNVTAHVAGALGKPCWLLLQRTPLWYWGHEGTDTLFYPTIKTYRQSCPPEWNDTIAALAADLDDFFA